MSMDPNELLMGTGVPSATFPEKGTVVKGLLGRIAVQQQTDFQTKAPLFTDAGEPRMQLVITLKTELRDPTINHDDGTRKLYVRGQMQQAIREAVIAAGAEGLEDGGTLAVQWFDDKPSQKGSPQKIYVAQYRAPQRAGDLLGTTSNGGQQQPTQAPQQAPQYQPPTLGQQPQPTLGQQPAPAAGVQGPTTGTDLI